MSITVRFGRILRVVVVVAGIVALLLLLAAVSLRTDTAKRMVLAQIQQYLAKQGVVFEAENFAFRLRPLQISTGRVSLQSASARDLPPIFSADHFSATIRLPDLIHGRYRIDDLQIDNPSIRIVIDEQHRDNIPVASGARTTTNEFLDLIILKLRSTGGSLTFDDRSQDRFVHIPKWDLSVAGNERTGLEEVQLQIRETSNVRYSGRTVPIDNIVVMAAMDLHNRTLNLHSAQLSNGLGDVTLNGTIANLSDPLLDLKVAGNFHLKPAAQFLSIAENVRGDVNLQLSVIGRPSELQITGHLTGRNLTAERFSGIAVDTDLAVDLGSGRARLTAIRARSPGISASGDATLAFTAPAGESRVNARFDVADLNRLLAMFHLSEALVASSVSGNIQARWPGMETRKLVGSGDLQLTGHPADSPGHGVPADGRIHFNASGNSLRASLDSLDAGALHLTGQFGLNSQNQIDGALRVDVSDTGQALPQIANWFAGSLPKNLQLSGPATIEAILDGTMKRPTISANIEANSLQLNALKDIHIQANAEFSPEEIVVPQISLQWEADSATGSGRIDLTTPVPAIDGRFEVLNVSIRNTLRALGKSEIPADGNVNIDATISGTTERLLVQAKLAASDLQAYGESFGTASAEVSLQDQVVQLDALSLSKPGGGGLQASGRYDIASGTYALDLSGQEIQLKRLVLPQGNALSGSLNLEAKTSGRFDNPDGVFKINARDFRVDSKELGAIDLDVNLADHLARIAALAPSFGIKASASVGIRSPYAAEVELLADNSDISRFPIEQLKSLSGLVTANLSASGNLNDIQGARVRADVSNFKLDVRDHVLTNDGTIGLRYANRELTVSQAAVRLDDSTIRFSGNVPLDDGPIGQLKVEGRVNLADLSNLLVFETPVHAEGQLVLNGSLRGNLKRIEPDLTLAITDAAIETSALPAPLTQTTLSASVKNGHVMLEQLTGEFGGAHITAVGEAPLTLLPQLPVDIPRPDTPIRLSMDVQKFNLSALTRPPENTDGTISLKIEAQAPRPDLNAVQALVTFPDLRFNVGTFSMEQTGVSSIALQNGIATVQQFNLSGPQTSLKLAGSADLRQSGPLEVKLSGDTDAAVLALFSNAVKGTGATRLNVDVGGTLRQPKVNGFVEVHDGQAHIDMPRMAAENIQLRLDLKGDRFDVTRLEGNLNGGAIKGEGWVNVFGPQRGMTRLTITGDGIYMEFPAGLKTVSNAEIRLDGEYPKMVISGNIDVEEGAYTAPIALGTGLMRYLTGDLKPIPASNQPADLQDTRLDLTLRTVSPIEVNNNIARGEIEAQLRLVGTIEQPGLIGKIDVDEGSRLYLRERKYSVDRGVITFTNEHAIEPILNVIATTSASGYDITMTATGNVTKKVDTVLTSNPPLDEEDIVYVLVTGKKRDEASGQTVDIAKEQALYIAGDLGTSVTSEAGRALGLNQFQIDPVLIGKEAEPTARLTMGKDVTRKLSLVYSMNLRDSSDQIWVADYNVTRRLVTSGIRQSDNTFRLQVQHDILFGLHDDTAKTARAMPKKIGAIHFSGDTHLTMEKLASVAGLKSGKTYDFFSVQNARERLGKALTDNDRLEARISVEKKTEGSFVDLNFQIREGPQVRLVFEGWELSEDLKSRSRAAWTSGVIDVQRMADVTDIIENALVKERFFGFQIESSVETPAEDVKSVVFKIHPGTSYDELRAVFEGVHSIPESELQSILKKTGFFDYGQKERDQAALAIESLYRERGYLDVKVDPPLSQLDNKTRTVRSVFHVVEGKLYHFGDIRFQGNAEFTDSDLSMRIMIGPETPFQVATAQKALQTLQELYRNTGYSDAMIAFSQTKNVEGKVVDIAFDIKEGLQRKIKEIRVEGNKKTSNGLVRSQLALEPGDILSDDKLSEARNNLYESGAFSFVETEVTSLEPEAGLKPNQVPVRLVVRVREIQPWDLNYGGFYDTDRGPGIVTDISNRNMLGSARVLGIRVRYDSQLREGRMYYSQPMLRRFPIKTLFSAFKSREKDTDDVTGRTTVTNKSGLSPTFEYYLRKNKDNVLTLGYRLERTHTYDVVADPLYPDVNVRTAPLTTSFTRDSRDNPFDATRGHFTSHAFDWGSSKLGSDLTYIKYFGQFFDYWRLGKPSVVPWTQTVRNRYVFANGIRAGFLRRREGEDFRSEQFKTGGGTTVRGFDQDRLGPLDSEGNPTGGDAVLILNSELRFPMYKFFDGVAFVDAGNVYQRLEEFDPFDLRASYGFGLRVRTPYMLLRFDFGFNMNRRPAEPRGKFFFSIGQAF